MPENKIKILLIEDNLGDVRLFTEMLKDTSARSFEIIHVSSLSDTLTILTDQKIDVILLDLELPDSHHLDTLLQVKAQVIGVPIVILTGHDNEEYALRAVQLGAQDYLVKQRVNAEVISRVIRYAIERQKLQDAVRSLTLIDDLTGLNNRRGFFTLAEHHLKLAQRMKKNFYLIFADVDNMKIINDEHGHNKGDLALIKTADILRNSFRDSDIIARIGGDEFAVLIPDTGDSNTEATISRLQDNVNDFNREVEYELSLSMGVAHFKPNLKISIQELLDRADMLLYKQKRKKHINLKRPT